MNKTLYVGNIPYTATEDEVASQFAAYGGRNARIIEGRGFAFVDIDGDQLDTAILEKHNSEMAGRRLTVNEATPRGEGASRSGVGGYGGGGDRRDSNRGGYEGGNDRW